MIRRYLSFIIYHLSFSVALLLTSCNLFIDDEDIIDENGFANVPIHSGMGYDHPITINDAGCKITYQYNSNVRQLSYEEQQRYIVNTKQDATGAFLEIHYRLDTPTDLLPVPGEILVSTVTELFPWGCNHRVQYRVSQDGVYKYIATFAQLEETYKELDIDGTITQKSEEDFYVEAEPLDEDSGDEEPAANEVRTRGDDEGTDINIGDKVTVSVLDKGFKFRIPFAYQKTQKNEKGHVSYIGFPKDKNYFELKEELDFDNFSISKRNFKIQQRETLEEQLCLEVKDGFSKEWRIHRWRPLKGKVVTVGPVVLVFFVNIDLCASIDLDITTNFTYHKSVQFVYDIDLYNCTLKKSTRVLSDDGWKYGEVVATMTASVWLDVHLGIGIYGKILSVRIIPSFKGTFEAKSPKVYKDSRGWEVFDVTERAAPTFTATFSVTLGVFIDISLSNILGQFEKQVDTDAQRKLLEELEADAQQTSEYYQAVIDSDEAAYDPNKIEGGQEEDVINNRKITFGPFNIVKPIEFPWYPVIEDNTLRVNRYWDEKKQQMSFSAEYGLKELGTLHNLFGKEYIPALCLKRGNEVVDYYFPEEGGITARLKTTMAYHFYLPTMDDDKKYTVSPCYFASAYDKGPAAMDKGLHFNATSPHAIITSITPTKYIKKDNDKHFADELKWTHIFKFSTIVNIAGMDYINSWGLRETFFVCDREYGQTDDKKLKDGNYKINWSYEQPSNESYCGVLLNIVPYFYVDKVENRGSEVSLGMNSDGEWSVSIDGVENTGTFNSRAIRAPQQVTEQRGPSSLLGWPSRDGTQRSQSRGRLSIVSIEEI